MPEAPLPPKHESRTSSPAHRGRTPVLDAQLVSAYRSDPTGFARGTTWNLLAAIVLFAVAGILAGIADRIVGLASGGLALIAMGLLPFLLGLAALDEVRWRRLLVARHGEIPPPLIRMRGAKTEKGA